MKKVDAYQNVSPTKSLHIGPDNSVQGGSHSLVESGGVPLRLSLAAGVITGLLAGNPAGAMLVERAYAIADGLIERFNADVDAASKLP